MTSSGHLVTDCTRAFSLSSCLSWKNNFFHIYVDMCALCLTSEKNDERQRLPRRKHYNHWYNTELNCPITWISSSLEGISAIVEGNRQWFFHSSEIPTSHRMGYLNYGNILTGSGLLSRTFEARFRMIEYQSEHSLNGKIGNWKREWTTHLCRQFHPRVDLGFRRGQATVYSKYAWNPAICGKWFFACVRWMTDYRLKFD